MKFKILKKIEQIKLNSLAKTQNGKSCLNKIMATLLRKRRIVTEQFQGHFFRPQIFIQSVVSSFTFKFLGS